MVTVTFTKTRAVIAIAIGATFRVFVLFDLPRFRVPFAGPMTRAFVIVGRFRIVAAHPTSGRFRMLEGEGDDGEREQEFHASLSRALCYAEMSPLRRRT